jgi:hypothetical protein
MGGLAAVGFMAASRGAVGNVLTKAGRALEQKVGVGGAFGWRSLVGQKIGKPIRETGEKMLEKRYALDAAAARSRIQNIDRELRITTDPAKERLLLNQLSNLIKQFQNNPYVLRNIQEELKTISPYSAGKILSNPTILQGLGSPQAPLEARMTVIDLIDKVKSGDLRKMTSDINWLNVLPLLSPDVQNAISEKMRKEFNEADAVRFLDDINRFNLLTNPQFQFFRQTLNRISKNFVEGLITGITTGAIDEISNALSRFSMDAWQEPGISTNIYQILQNQPRLRSHIEDIFLDTIAKSDQLKQEAILLNIRKEDKNTGPTRIMMRNLFRPSPLVGPTGQPILTPQQQKAAQLIQSNLISGRASSIIGSL